MKRKWTFSVEKLAGEMCAVLREEGKMDTIVRIEPEQQAWFNALRNLLESDDAL